MTRDRQDAEIEDQDRGHDECGHEQLRYGREPVGDSFGVMYIMTTMRR